MKILGLLFFIAFGFFTTSVFSFKSAGEQPYDKAVKYFKGLQGRIEQLSNDSSLSSNEKARIVALKKTVNSFLGIVEESTPQIPATPQTSVIQEHHEESDIATPQLSVVSNDTQEHDDQDEPDVQKPAAKPQVKPVTQPIVQPVALPAKATEQKVVPVKTPIVKPEPSGDDSVHAANDIVDEYFEANLAYLVADKNNPLIISPFAGAADKAARKTYETAKARLKKAQVAFNGWLAKTTKAAEDFVAVQNTLKGMIANLQQPLAQAKKDNPTFATSDKDKVNRAKYEDLKQNMDIAQAILKELNKKK